MALPANFRLVAGNDIKQNCKHLKTDAHVRTKIKNNQAKLKQLRFG
jgi:hypothetical protein